MNYQVDSPHYCLFALKTGSSYAANLANAGSSYSIGRKTVSINREV